LNSFQLLFYNQAAVQSFIYFNGVDSVFVTQRSGSDSWTTPLALITAFDLFSIAISHGFVPSTGDANEIPLVAYHTRTEYNVFNPVPEVIEVGNQYRIRKGIPQVTQTIGDIVGGSLTTIQLPATASPVDDFYTGEFIWIYNRNLTTVPTDFFMFNDFRLIRDYQGSTRTATVTEPFSYNIQTASITAGNTLNWEILRYARDEYTPINGLVNTPGHKLDCCYEIELISLLLPNKTLKTGNGNRIAFYPYVYVQFSDPTQNAPYLIDSNNPNATHILFKVPIDNVNQPDRAAFVSLRAGGMVQTVPFKLFDRFRFTVWMYNGEVFEVNEEDTMPPIPADFSIQVSATFSLRRMVQSNI
jgi:hypothetical protein